MKIHTGTGDLLDLAYIILLVQNYRSIYTTSIQVVYHFYWKNGILLCRSSLFFSIIYSYSKNDGSTLKTAVPTPNTDLLFQIQIYYSKYRFTTPNMDLLLNMAVQTTKTAVQSPTTAVKTPITAVCGAVPVFWMGPFPMGCANGAWLAQE